MKKKVDDLLELEDDLLDMDDGDDLLSMEDDLLDIDEDDDLLAWDLEVNTRDWADKWTADPRDYIKEAKAIKKRGGDFEMETNLPMYDGWTAFQHFMYWTEKYVEKNQCVTLSVAAMGDLYALRAGARRFLVLSKTAQGWQHEALVVGATACGTYADLLIKLPNGMEHLSNQVHLKSHRSVNFNLKTGAPTDAKEPFYIDC